MIELKEIRSSNDYIELFGNDKKTRLKIASSRPMGYGLYIDAMMDLDEYIEICEKKDLIR